MRMKEMIILLSFLGILIGCSDTVSTSYIGYDDIVADKSIERGWMPAIIPKSAFHIKESHDIDTNTGQGLFQFRSTDISDFKENLGAEVDSQRRDSLREKYNLPHGEVYQWKKFIFSINWDRNEAEFRLIGDA